jgi:hypothetical protein
MKKLEKKDIENIMALTPVQEGMLFHYLKNPGGDQYFEQLCLNISGQIDTGCFQQAWEVVIETNEMLRTLFRWEKLEKPMQIILKEHKCNLRLHDLTGKNSGRKKAALEEIKEKDKKDGFDLNSVPFRVLLCKIDESKYQMIISNHHILYDGWSNRIILKEFFSSYIDLVQQKSPGKPVKQQYKEYIKWIQTQDRDKQEKYWTGYLNGIEDKSELSIKKKRGKNINAEPGGNSNYKVKFSRQLKEKSGIFTKSHKITLACLLYSAWGILLQGYNNCEDVIFGTTVSGRSPGTQGIEDIVGLFINTVPLRVRTNCHRREKIKDFLYRVNKELREREEYESVSLVEIMEYGGVVFEDEFFDTIFVIENYPLDKVLSERNNPFSLSVDSYSIFETTHYDLTVGVTLNENIEVEFTYKEDLFDEDIIKKMAGHFVKIVGDMVTNPGKELAALEILSETEKNKILFEFNNTTTDYARDKTIHQLFAAQVERIPDHIALVGPLQEKNRTYMSYMTYLSYRELNKKSDRLAHLLIEKGIKPDTIVGIMLERSIEMVIGILGILRAGGAYLPIDPGYPEKRIHYMLKDSGANILLTHNDITPSPSTLTSTSTCQVSPTNLAYIIYTSGTTGKPRGVNHRETQGSHGGAYRRNEPVELGSG